MDSKMSFKSVMVQGLLAFSLFAQFGQAESEITGLSARFQDPAFLEDRQVAAKPTTSAPAAAKTSSVPAVPAKTSSVPAVPAKTSSVPAAGTAKPTSFPVIDSVISTLPYMKAPEKNKGAFWSGIPFKLSQSASKALGLQTLEMSVPELIFPQHPDSQYGSPKRRYFWDWFSEGYAQTLVTSGSKEVTVFLRAPSIELTGPSDPYTDGRMVRRSDWSELEYPVMIEANFTVWAVHPLEEGPAGMARYEIYPNDKGYLWQQKYLNDTADVYTGSAAKAVAGVAL